MWDRNQMSVQFSIDTNKYLTIGGGAIINGIRDLKYHYDKYAKTDVSYTSSDGGVRLEVCSKGAKPYLILEYSTIERKFIGYANDWHQLTQIDGFFAGVPVAEFTKLLNLCNSHGGIWKIVTLPLWIYIDPYNDAEDFKRYMFKESIEAMLARLNKNHDGIMSEFFYKLELSKTSIDDFLNKHHCSGIALNQYMPAIETLYPGFEEEFSELYTLQQQVNERIQREYVRTRFTIINHILVNEALFKSMNVKNWYDRQCHLLATEIHAIGEDFKYPGTNKKLIADVSKIVDNLNATK